MHLGAAVLSDGKAVGTAVGTADGTADVGVVPDGGSGGWGIVALGLRYSPSLGWQLNSCSPVCTLGVLCCV